MNSNKTLLEMANGLVNIYSQMTEKDLRIILNALFDRGYRAGSRNSLVVAIANEWTTKVGTDG